jgi:hypothetical protein
MRCARPFEKAMYIKEEHMETWRRGSSRWMALMAVLLAMLGALIPATPSFACYTWSTGGRVGLRAGGEIREGSGAGYRVHTRVPEDNWQVDLIGAPRSADGHQWWNVSRKNLDGGGTGWVSMQQAGFDICGSGSTQPPAQPQPPAPQPPQQPQPALPSNAIRLYEHADQGGAFEDFTGSDTDLRDNRIGNDHASYVWVPSGWRVALYSDINYRGTCQEFTGSTNLPGTKVGNDTVSSLEVNAACQAQGITRPDNWLIPWQPYKAGRPKYALAYLGTMKNCKNNDQAKRNTDHRFLFNVQSTDDVNKLRIWSDNKNIQAIFDRKPAANKSLSAADLDTNQPWLCFGLREVTLLHPIDGAYIIERELYVWVDD